MVFTIDPTTWAQPRFLGKEATRKVSQHLLRGPGIQRALKDDTESSYLGDTLALSIPGKPKLRERRSLVDVLSQLARPLRWFDRSHINDDLHHEAATMPIIQLDSQGHRLQLHYAGAGAWGNVFQLRIDDGPPMALKVFYQTATLGRTTGRFAEAGRGLFVTRQGLTKDAAKILLANPKDYWLLAEWIDPIDSPQHREGRPLEAGHFRFVDDFNGSHLNANRIGGIRIDYGTMFQPPRETLEWARDTKVAKPGSPKPFKFSRRPSFREFETAVKNPDTRFGPMSLLDALSQLHPEERFQAFHLGVHHPALRKTALGVHLLPRDVQPEAMWIMLERPEFTGDLMTLLKGLDPDDRRVFKRALLGRPPGKAHYALASSHDPEKQAHWTRRFFKQILPGWAIEVRPGVPSLPEQARKAG